MIKKNLALGWKRKDPRGLHLDGLLEKVAALVYLVLSVNRYILGYSIFLRRKDSVRSR